MGGARHLACTCLTFDQNIDTPLHALWYILENVQPSDAMERF
jgi:hypothetical protein